jgi:hypothetical protein
LVIGKPKKLGSPVVINGGDCWGGGLGGGLVVGDVVLAPVGEKVKGDVGDVVGDVGIVVGEVGDVANVIVGDVVVVVGDVANVIVGDVVGDVVS